MVRASKGAKPKFRVGQRVIIPDVKGLTFAGHPMQQDQRNIGQTGTIIGSEDCAGVQCPRIRLDGGTRRIVMGYECWWKPLRKRERGPAKVRGRE